mmetsp:Transcript_12547/g.23560  ORF Transcript_12547/g.23560 Transcript_12547/m.23560 type:complete len:227 (-) Transcript_12547:388-1068(-)
MGQVRARPAALEMKEGGGCGSGGLGEVAGTSGANQTGNAIERTESQLSSSTHQSQETVFKACVLGTIASSCCWVQLLLNLFSNIGIMKVGLGCAGFNTVLGPLRPFTRLMTIVWLAWNWISRCRGTGTSIGADGKAANFASGARGSKETSSRPDCCNAARSKKPIFASILCSVLMFSPEMVTFYDRHLKHVGARELHSYFLSISEDREVSSQHLIRLDYVVDNMGW